MPKGKQGFQKYHKPWNKGLKGILSGKNRYNWKGGLPKCLNCGKLLKDYESKKCKKCYGISIKGENHHHWKGGVSKNKEYLSRKRKERRHLLGVSKSYNDKNGIYKYKRDGKVYGDGWHEIRKEIYKRDNWTCRECECKCVGKKSKDSDRVIQCHHIDYDIKNNDPINLITLCVSCHTKTNFERNDWTRYFRGRVK